MPKIMRHRRYVKTFSDNNNNKFWYITEHDDGSILVEWGRIGKAAQSKLHPAGSKSFDSLCAGKEKEKSDGEPPYRLLNVVDAPADITPAGVTKSKNNDLEDIAIKQIAGGDKEVEKLIRYIAKQNIHNILNSTTMTYNESTGLFSTPCGVVTHENIDSARDLLVKMIPYIKKSNFVKDYARLLEDYLMLIPQEVRDIRDFASVLPNTDAVDKQNSILDSLEASLDSIKKDPARKVEVENKVFGVTLSLLTDSKEFDRVNQLYKASMNRSHSCSHLKLDSVYNVNIQFMTDRFEKIGKPIGNIRRLWHGTRVANVLSILHKGLLIPPSNASHCTGRMFGDGLYFSDQSTKSLNYSYGYWGGGSKDNNCFMFMADVAMGKEYTPRSPCSGIPHGHDSCFAKGGQSGVSNNEMIVYQVGQANLVHLCKFAN